MIYIFAKVAFMILPKIMNVGVYREAQKSSQISRTWGVGLYLKGKVRQTTYYPDGTIKGTFDAAVDEDVPTLSIGAPGFKTVFEFDSTRENWWIMLAFPALKYDDTTRKYFWNYNGHLLELPNKIVLKSAEAAELKKTFENISRLYSSSLPQNQLQAELEILKLLQYFLRQPIEEDEPVELLRKQLEQDTQWQYSITEHCSRLGGNRDLLRNKFVERYQISPGDFRRQMRLRRILHLIVYSSMSLKEIAFECGMKNLSHLSSFIRKECGKTASDLCREYRRRAE